MTCEKNTYCVLYLFNDILYKISMEETIGMIILTNREKEEKPDQRQQTI